MKVKWTVETLDEIVDAEVESLPADMRARLAHIARLIEEVGLERVREPLVKHLDGHVWRCGSKEEAESRGPFMLWRPVAAL
ncbi:MAG TPA: hypothetical protein VHZ25_05255 [Acidobacteriaceae bacterium]|nr:hypothetical protein [Acidobacteriaceae bacterium]